MRRLDKAGCGSAELYWMQPNTVIPVPGVCGRIMTDQLLYPWRSEGPSRPDSRDAARQNKRSKQVAMEGPLHPRAVLAFWWLLRDIKASTIHSVHEGENSWIRSDSTLEIL